MHIGAVSIFSCIPIVIVGGKRTFDQLPREIAKNRAILASACSRAEHEFEHFCYPSGYLNSAGDDVLRGSGIKSATMVEQGINAPGAHPYRLRRFLDGRSVSQASFEAYLSGALEIYETAIKKLPDCDTADKAYDKHLK